jgi:predicted nucleotide-binding protein
MPYRVTLYLTRLSFSVERTETAAVDLPTRLEKYDLDEVTLERQILRPYREGSDIFIEGRRVPAARIREIQVWYAESISDEAEEQDVTDEVLHRDTSTSDSSLPASVTEFGSSDIGDQRSVFLVYGRWHDAVEAMREFLGSLDLKVIEWEQAVQTTGKANPYIGEILDAGFKMAYATVVLMTPDDVAALHPHLQPANTQPESLAGQPRPNVIFEAGMAWQQFRTRTLLVEFGHLRGFSDLGGVHMVRLDGSPQTRRTIASRLKTIGCAVDDSGDRWLSAGSFPSDLPRPTAADLGFAPHKKIESRGVVAPAEALSGIPMRWILLSRLAKIHREQASSSTILDLDVAGIAEQASVELEIVKSILSELLDEGLVEGFAESLGQTALDGACRITAQGLRRLRAEA